jgi:transposase
VNNHHFRSRYKVDTKLDLTDEQWAALEPLIPKPPRRADGRGRPWRDTREVLNGILWILRTGAPWKDLPDRYPPYQTCHRRFQRWVETKVLDRVLQALAQDLQERGDIDLSECFIDGTFVVAKKGGAAWERPSGARGKRVRRSWQLQTALVFHSPCTWRVLLRMESASPHEVTLVDATIQARFTEDPPQRLIGDRAYDSDPLDAALQEQGIQMIAPHRRNRKKPKSQDGRPVRRYRRRWKVEVGRSSG